MNDEYLNKGKVIMCGAWGVVIVLMLTAWVIMIWAPHAWLIGGMLAAMACAGSAISAMLNIRCYAVRVATLVRATADLEGSGLERPRSIRDR